MNLHCAKSKVTAFARTYGESPHVGIAQRLADDWLQMQAEIERLRAIVDTLPKCWRLNEHGALVQDVPVTPRMQVWMVSRDGHLYHRVVDASFRVRGQAYLLPSSCSSTRAAAEAAKGGASD